MRLTRGNSRVRPDGGAAAVELALVLPVLLLLVFGIVQYGWYFFQAQETTFAVREGARVAAVGAGNAQQVCELIGRKMATTDGAKVSVATAGPNVGDQITVTVARQATNFHLPFIPFPASLQQMNQEALTRAENVITSATATFNGTVWDFSSSSGTCS